MNKPLIGLVAGMGLAFAAAFGGFGAFLLVAALGAVGLLAGILLDDGESGQALRELFRRGRR